MNKKTYIAVLNGKSDNNISYADFQSLILDLGFNLQRQKGSHTMYFNDNICEFLNIQKDGAKAKSYQVKQLRQIIIKHNL